MAHNGGRAQVNATLRASGYELCGAYINAMDYPQQGPFTLRQIADDFGFWENIPGNDAADYVDQSTGAYLQPPAGYRWASTYFRGLWGKSEDRWVVTWTGVCDPIFTVRDFSEDGSGWYGGSIVHVPEESSANRKVFKLINMNPVVRADGPHTRWVQKSGEFGHSIICNLYINSQNGPVGNLKIFRPEDEARMLSGKRLSQRTIDQYQGIGVLRFMDAMSTNWHPHISEAGQITPPGWTGANERHYKVSGRVTATVLGPNHWQLSTRSGYISATDGMHVSFPWSPSAMYCKVTAKGATTEFEVIGHGFSTGDRIMRRRVYWSDGVPEGGQNAFQNGTLDAVTKLYDCFPVTVVSADRFTIPYNSTSDANVTVGTSYWFIRALKIRYGGVDYYAHDGTAKSPLIEFGPASLGAGDMANWLLPQFGRRCNAFFVIPPGKTATDGTFMYGSGTQRHPEDIMELVNETRAHVWVNIPSLASDALVQWYAEYFRDNIGAGQEVWFERGNEIWNSGFSWQKVMDFYAKSSAWAAQRGSWGWASGTQTKKMAQIVQTAFAGSGKTHKIIISTQAGSGTIAEKEREFYALDDAAPRPIDYAHYIASAPYMYAGPVSMYGNSIDVTTPGFKEAVKAFKDDTRPWGQKRNGLSWLRDHLINRNTTIFNTLYAAPTGQYHVLAEKWNKKNVWYEGGTHFSYNDMRNGFDGSANALGCTYQDIKEYWWEFRHSPEAGEWLTDYYNKYVSASPHNLYPSQFLWTGYWDYKNAGGNLSWYWQVWPMYSPEYMTAGRTGQVEAFLAWNNTGAGAVLTGRGFLTATASGAKNTSASPVGRGSLAATGTKSAQVFYGLSNYAENAVLDFLLRATGTSPTTVYLALHTGGTGEDGTTNEVSTSTGYARTAITFDAPSGGQIVSAANVAFGPFSSAPGQITNFSIWTAASGGNCLATGAFTSSASPLSGYSLNVPAGGIQITAN